MEHVLQTLMIVDLYGTAPRHSVVNDSIQFRHVLIISVMFENWDST